MRCNLAVDSNVDVCAMQTSAAFVSGRLRFHWDLHYAILVFWGSVYYRDVTLNVIEPTSKTGGRSQFDCLKNIYNYN